MLQAALIIGIDDQPLAQTLRGAGEPRQDQHAVVVGAGGDEFLGHQVHAIAKRRDEQHVRGPVEHGEVASAEPVTEIAHRRPFRRRKPAADAADQAIDLLAQRAVLRHALARRHLDLHEADAPVPFGVPRQKRVIGVQALRDALGIVQPIDAENDALGGDRRPQLPHFGEHRRIGAVAIELLRLDAERKAADAREVSVMEHLAAGERDVRAHQRARAFQEVCRVFRGVESDQVRAEQTGDDLAGPR